MQRVKIATARNS